ncbi:MAG: hypothetical protein HQL37_03555 [Alphaproteobacteria bacterium]|nr:hypothetical protein [Alphaproteobacteria bacterium]
MMTEQIPTVSEVFGPEPSPDPLPTISEAFGSGPAQKPLSGLHWDNFFSNTTNALSKALDGFGVGFSAAWGDKMGGLSDETERDLKQLGVFNDYSTGRANWLKSANEALIRPLTTASQFLASAGVGAAAGVGSLAASAGLTPESAPNQLTRDLVGMLMHEGASPSHVAIARDLNVIGPRAVDASEWSPAMGKALDALAPERGVPAEVARAVPEQAPAAEHVFTPTEPVAAAPEPAAVPEAEAAPAVPDVHQIARDVAPDVMAQYEALTARRDTYRRWIDELDQTRRAEAERTTPHNQDIDQLQGQLDDLQRRADDANPRKAKIYEARMEPLRAQLDELRAANADAIAATTEHDNADMACVRAELMRNDYAMRDLAPEVSAAFREAERRMPTEQPVETAPQNDAGRPQEALGAPGVPKPPHSPPATSWNRFRPGRRPRSRHPRLISLRMSRGRWLRPAAPPTKPPPSDR